MVNVANQRLDGRIPQRKDPAFAEFTLPDRQYPVATIQIANLKCKGFANPYAGGVQQAEERHTPKTYSS